MARTGWETVIRRCARRLLKWVHAITAQERFGRCSREQAAHSADRTVLALARAVAPLLGASFRPIPPLSRVASLGTGASLALRFNCKWSSCATSAVGLVSRSTVRGLGTHLQPSWSARVSSLRQQRRLRQSLGLPKASKLSGSFPHRPY